MNRVVFFIGVAMLIVGVVLSIPSMILEKLGSPIKSEAEAGKTILDAWKEGLGELNTPQTEAVIESGKESLRVIDILPKILIGFGVFVIFLSLFIPE